MTPTTARLFYLIATYGKNFAPKIKLCPAVSTQIANLQYFYPQDATVRYIFVGDYARNIDGLDDLPVLKSTLKKVSLQERGLLVIDDISRLFRPCTLPNRPNLLSELEPFGDRLVSRRENA